MNEQLHFAPSRFVGYRGVTFQKHAFESDLQQLDGKLTNPALSKVLGVPLVEDIGLDAAYRKFLVEVLGFKGQIPNIGRKYWLTEDAIDLGVSSEPNGSVPEGLPETERAAFILARKGQVAFRKTLIRYWKGCAVTGCTMISVLRASHIQPWSDSDPAQRLDPYNGLLLTPNIDVLFDSGLITFDHRGGLVCSRALPKSAQSQLLPKNTKPIILDERHEAYMAYHREHVFIS